MSAVMWTSAALLLVGAAGCGARRGAQSSEDTASGSGATGAGATAGSQAAKSSGGEGSSAQVVRANRVVLSDRECIHFEPHWTTIHTGQTLTWHSDLKRAVTIHVPAGACERTEYVLRPGATLTTGPCKSPGAYSVWTEPAACRDIPRGAQGPSPGFSVEGS